VRPGFSKLNQGDEMSGTNTNGCDSHMRDVVCIRPQHAAAQCCHRVHHRHCIEWYDFFIYGIAAGLIFGKLYFPYEQPLTGTLAAFGTYFIGFVGRPIGAAIFGHGCFRRSLSRPASGTPRTAAACGLSRSTAA
jgi:hypothetical protein